MQHRIGLIVEDKSDVDVLSALAGRVCPRSSFVFRHFVGNGCGKILGKCGAWANILWEKGCRLLIVVHDRDRNDAVRLKRELEKALTCIQFKNWIVVIPVEEIEAWILADLDAVVKVLGLKKALHPIANPESINSPKEKLQDLVYSNSLKTKRYVHTIHNARVAKVLSLKQLRRCNAFVDFERFIKDNCDPERKPLRSKRSKPRHNK